MFTCLKGESNCMNAKCNWCNKRSSEIFRIKKHCKWYNFNICKHCYTNKMLYENNKRPISNPSIFD